MQIFVAKYVKDVRRGEPRNIGVVVMTDTAIRSRFRGVNPDGSLDRRNVKFAQSPDVYHEWVKFWKRSIDAGSSGLDHALERSRSSYLLVRAGEVLVGGSTSDIDKLADQFYRELVEGPLPRRPVVEGPSLDRLAEDVLDQAGTGG